jgi:poly(A) polymerase Pap1
MGHLTVSDCTVLRNSHTNTLTMITGSVQTMEYCTTHNAHSSTSQLDSQSHSKHSKKQQQQQSNKRPQDQQFKKRTKYLMQYYCFPGKTTTNTTLG